MIGNLWGKKYNPQDVKVYRMTLFLFVLIMSAFVFWQRDFFFTPKKE